MSAGPSRNQTTVFLMRGGPNGAVQFQMMNNPMTNGAPPGAAGAVGQQPMMAHNHLNEFGFVRF
jgi:hypothetical protein